MADYGNMPYPLARQRQKRRRRRLLLGGGTLAGGHLLMNTKTGRKFGRRVAIGVGGLFGKNAGRSAGRGFQSATRKYRQGLSWLGNKASSGVNRAFAWGMTKNPELTTKIAGQAWRGSNWLSALRKWARAIPRI